jgi:hypothetical protein
MAHALAAVTLEVRSEPPQPPPQEESGASLVVVLEQATNDVVTRVAATEVSTETT